MDMWRTGIVVALWLAAGPDGVSQAREATARDFARAAEYESVLISPGGDYVLMLKVDGSESIAVFLDTETFKIVGATRSGDGTRLQSPVWVNDERALFELARTGPGSLSAVWRGELVSVNADGSDRAYIFGPQAPGPEGAGGQGQSGEQAFVHLVSRLADDPRHVLVAKYPWPADQGSVPSLAELDVYDGGQDERGRGTHRNARFVADHDGVVRFAMRVDEANRPHVEYRASNESEWQELEGLDCSRGDMGPLLFAADNRHVYVAANNGEDRAGLYLYDTQDHTSELLYRDERVDVGGVVLSADRTTVVAVLIEDGVPRLEYLDETAAEGRRLRAISKAFAGQVAVFTSISSDGTLAVVQSRSAQNPGTWYLFNTQTSRAELLVHAREWIDPEAMAPTRAVVVPTADDQQLNAYLTVPDVRAPGALPMVLMVHGEPHEGRNHWTFDPLVQFLASRGYIVLQVDYRGSLGYGRAFEAAGRGQWSGKVVGDLRDAAKWAADEGIADPGRMCILGRGRGGYFAALGVVQNPGMFACVAIYSGLYDLSTLRQDAASPVTWKGPAGRTEPQFTHEILGGVGDGPAPTSLLELTGQIDTPVFVAHGKENALVPAAKAKAFAKALKKAKVPRETFIASREGQTFVDSDSLTEFYQRLAKFLDEHTAAKSKRRASRGQH